VPLRRGTHKHKYTHTQTHTRTTVTTVLKCVLERNLGGSMDRQILATDLPLQDGMCLPCMPTCCLVLSMYNSCTSQSSHNTSPRRVMKDCETECPYFLAPERSLGRAWKRSWPQWSVVMGTNAACVFCLDCVCVCVCILTSLHIEGAYVLSQERRTVCVCVCFLFIYCVSYVCVCCALLLLSLPRMGNFSSWSACSASMPINE
jgi:hypothetical protein